MDPYWTHALIHFLLDPDFEAKYLVSMVELSGIEPLTSSLRTRRSPN
jgi:hypothetical protein